MLPNTFRNPYLAQLDTAGNIQPRNLNHNHNYNSTQRNQGNGDPNRGLVRSLEDVKTHALLYIIENQDFTYTAKNEVWMNERDVSYLFSFRTVLNFPEKLPKYVEIANLTYRVAVKEWLNPGCIVLNPLQKEACDLSESQKHILVKASSEFYSSQRPLSAVVVEIRSEFENEELGGVNNIERVDVQELSSFLKQRLYGHFFKKNQELLIKTKDGIFVATLKSGKLGTFGPLGRVEDTNWSLNTVGVITLKTAISFKVSNSNEIQLTDCTHINTGGKLHFNVSVNHGLSCVINSKGWNKVLYKKPLIKNKTDLGEIIKANLSKKDLMIGDSFSLKTDVNKTMVVTLKKVEDGEGKRDVHGNVVVQPLGSYKRVYQLDDSTEVELLKGKNIILYKDNPYFLDAEKIHIEVIDCESEYEEREVRTPWIIQEELKESIIKKDDYFLEKEELVLELSTGKFLIRFQKGFSDNLESIEDLEEVNKKRGEGRSDVMWQITEETKVKITTKDSLSTKIVDNKNIELLDSLTVEIIGVESPYKVDEDDYFEEESPIVLSEKKMIKLFHEVRTKHLIKGQEFSIKLESGKSLTVKVNKCKYHDQKIKKAKYGTLGLCNKETKITIDNQEENKLIRITDSSSKKLSAIDINKKLEGINLGGISDKIKKELRSILLTRGPWKELMQKLEKPPIKGILIYGPPGTGKTTLARSLGKILGCRERNIKKISGSEVFEKWVGSSGENTRNLFENARKDLEKFEEESPLHMIIIDEAEVMLQNRSGGNHSTDNKVVADFLSQMDGLKEMHNVIVVAITNHPDLLDPAVRRPGRLEIEMELGVPDIKGRQEIFTIHLKELKKEGLIYKDVNEKVLVEKTKNWTGADIKGLVSSALAFFLDRLPLNKEGGEEEVINNVEEVIVEEKKANKEITKTKTKKKKAIDKIVMQDFLTAIEDKNGKKDNSHFSFYT